MGTDLLLLMVLYLLGCTGINISSSNTGISGKPYTPPTDILRTTTVSPSPAADTTTLPPRITLEPVNMPPDMSGRISGMLQVLPDVSGIHYGLVWYIDYRAWQETLGINITGYQGNQGNITTFGENTYVNDLILSSFNTRNTTRQRWQPWLGIPPFISGMGLWMYLSGESKFLKTPVRTINIGYGPLDVERSIWYSTFDGKELGTCEAIKGNFDVAVVAQAIRNNPDPASSPLRSSSSGIDIYSWDGSRNSDRALTPPFYDDYGQGRTLAVQPHDIFGSIQANHIDYMISASQGKTKSLADAPLFQEMAAKLELLDVMSVVMSDSFLHLESFSGVVDRYSQELQELFEKSAVTAPLLGPYVAYAAGLGVDELGLFVALVLVYEAPELAEKDIPILKERLAAGYNTTKDPWAVEVTSSDIWLDGNTLCAKLRGNVTSYWDRFIVQEPLLVRVK